MKTLTYFYLLFFLTSGLYAISTEYKHVERESTALEKKTYALLKQKFPGEMLNAELETLRELSQSPEYLNFLSQRYPNLAPFTTFEMLFNKLLPSKERYFKFFNEQFNIESIKEITDDEHFVAHSFASGFWISAAYRRGADKPIHLRPGSRRSPPPGMRGLAQPKGRKILERRLGIESKGTLTNADWVLIISTFGSLIKLSSIHLDEDVRWIKTLIKKHGQSDGLLWLVVQDPILFERILYAFSTKDTFLKCLYDPIDVYREERRSRGYED